MTHTIVHFEIPANDLVRLKGFYADLFGWGIETDTAFPDYLMVHTAPEGKGVNGGLAKRRDPRQTPLNYIDVESVDEYVDKVAKLGGQSVVAKTAIPKMGYFAVCLDPEGNAFGLFQMDEKAA